MEITYESLSALVSMADAQAKPISEIVIKQQAAELEISEMQLINKMQERFLIMKKAAEDGIKPGVVSISGLSGGDGHKLFNYSNSNNTICGSLFSRAIANAVAITEMNASMGLIVAAPTAGSSGILPGAVLALQSERNLGDEVCVRALFTASAIGMVISNKAYVSGAAAGCQAECGTASAMAAGALVELCGGDPDAVGAAVAMAFKNVLGLVCDPVAGLVEVPCIKRNAGGISNALCAAEMALAGVRSVIPADEVIEAMKKVGEALPCSLRETSEGGLAATPTGIRLKDQIFGHN